MIMIVYCKATRYDLAKVRRLYSIEVDIYRDGG